LEALRGNDLRSHLRGLSKQAVKPTILRKASRSERSANCM